MNRTTVIAISAAIAIGIGGLGYWLGQNPIAITSRNTTEPEAAADPSPTTVRHWELQAQFEGPLKDTVVQRWRDPATGVLCYIYLPVIVQHSAPLQNGMVHYGASDTGSISCVIPKR